MTEVLHELVENLASVRRWRQAESEATERADGIRARVAAADATFQAARAAWQDDFDAGRASGPPPQWFPPGDLGMVEHELQRIRERRRDALAACSGEADQALRRRSVELLAQAATHVDALEAVRAEAQLVCATARAVLSARGVPGAGSTIPSRLSIADLVAAVAAGELLPLDPIERPVPRHDPERPGQEESAAQRREAEERVVARDRMHEVTARSLRRAGRPSNR